MGAVDTACTVVLVFKQILLHILINMLFRLDVFSKIPKDLSEHSTAGALLTVFCAILIFVLASFEVRYYLQHQTHS